MMTRRPTALATAALAAAALTLAGCSAATEPGASDDGRIAVVASTNVFADIVETVGGDRVDVTALIANESQDPHDFEASAAAQLDVRGAQLLVQNGGGYDPFLTALVESSGSSAPVLSAVEYSPEWTGSDPSQAVEGFNEHVFYDPQTMAGLADAIADELARLDPADAGTFTANAAAFRADIDATITPTLDDIDAAHAGAEIFATEPVALYLTAAAGLENVTPEAFSEAVEAGQDVPPATLLDALDLIGGGSVRLVLVNAQAGGAETTQVEQKAGDAGVPVVTASELLPAGKTYVSWMADMATQLQTALDTGSAP